jgi:hypothetical protein
MHIYLQSIQCKHHHTKQSLYTSNLWTHQINHANIGPTDVGSNKCLHNSCIQQIIEALFYIVVLILALISIILAVILRETPTI